MDVMNKNYRDVVWTGPKFRIYRHLLALLVVAAIIYNLNPIYAEPFATYSKILLFCVLLVLFYSNMYWLVPHFLLRKKYPLYAVGIVFYICLTYLIVIPVKDRWLPYLEPGSSHKREDPKILSVMFLIIVLVSASTAIKLFQRWVLDTQRINELEKITMLSELEQLKNQINPHFLFNMLNNANVLTQKDPEKASQVLMKLSDLLRYQLYDSARPKVLLTADIHFLTDFLNLEKIRRDNFEFIVSKEGELSGVQIPPLMFITFVENAVKFSMDSEKRSYVNLHFDVKNNELHFICINSKPDMMIVKNSSGGLGLVNVKRRLQLLYPNKHVLNIQDNMNVYSVNLTVRL